MKEYIVTKYINDSYGNTIGERRFTIPQEIVNEIRADERENIMGKIKNISGHYWGIDGEIYLNARDVLEIFDKEQKNERK